MSLASLKAYLAISSVVLLHILPEWPLTFIQLTENCLSVERQVICSIITALGDFVIWQMLAVKNFLMPTYKSVNILMVEISIGKASRNVHITTNSALVDEGYRMKA